jgi:hypothetical protein
LKIYFTGPGPPVSSPRRFLTACTDDCAHVAHDRPDHRAVATLTAESAQAPVTASRCRCPCRKPLSGAEVGSLPFPFPSSSCAASALPRSQPPHCTSLPATSVLRCRRPSRGTTPPSPPLRVAATTSPSRRPMVPERIIHQVTVFLSLLHRRPPPSENLRPHHHVQEDRASP